MATKGGGVVTRALTTFVLVAVALLCSSCLAAQLRVPTHEHYVQLATLCHMGRDEADPGYASDVCHAARQACYLAAAVRSEDGAACDEVMR